MTMTLEKLPRTFNKYSLLWTEEESNIIQQYFDGTKESVNRIIRLIKDKVGLDRTECAVRHRASGLGITRNENRIRWTEKQEITLTELVGKLPPRIIAQKMGRSLRSIYQKCNELRLSNYHKDGWYSCSDVSKILGVSDELVRRWIKDKKLKAYFHDGNKFMFRIEENDLKLFIRSYPAELTGRNVDMVLLVDILCGLNYRVDEK